MCSVCQENLNKRSRLIFQTLMNFQKEGGSWLRHAFSITGGQQAEILGEAEFGDFCICLNHFLGFGGAIRFIFGDALQHCIVRVGSGGISPAEKSLTCLKTTACNLLLV